MISFVKRIVEWIKLKKGVAEIKPRKQKRQKGDNKIDDTVVKAKQAAAEEMAVASGVRYLMYAGSLITSTHILDAE